MNKLKWIKIFLTIAAIFFLYNLFISTNSNKKNVISESNYTKFITQINNKEIKEVNILERNNGPRELTVKPVKGKDFQLNVPNDDSLIDKMLSKDVVISTTVEQGDSFLTTFFFSWGPVLFLIAALLFIMKKSAGGGKGLLQMNKSKAQVIDPDKINVTFNDVVGCDEAKLEIQEFVDFLQNPNKFTKVGGKIPRGVLLTGPAGTGKAQPLYSMVKTPNGWIRMEDLRVNNLVCNPDGEYSKIVDIYPQGLKDNYTIYFSDHSVAESCDEHLWTVKFDESDINYQTLSLKEIKEKLDSGIKPILYPVKKIDSPEKELPIEPYIYGKLLGVEDHLFIQKNYLNASYNQRLSLLQGILDQNGVIEDNKLYYIASNEKLASNTLDLVRSLGGISYIETINDETFKIHIQSIDCSIFFKNEDKILLAKNLPHVSYKTIEQIIFKGQTNMQCIMLDSENHLYITDGYNVTHNTMMAKALAKESGVSFISISGSEFVEMFVGVGASRVRSLFENARKNAPCVIFIDEIDAIGGARSNNPMGGAGHDEREQTLNQILVELDGFDTNLGVLLVAATNRPEILDKALLRPGRIDRQIIVGLPDVNGREKILKIHSKEVPLDKNVDLAKIARGTPGFSGAELANIINEAAIFAARNNKIFVEQIDLEEAKDKIIMGVARASLAMSVSDKKDTAYHESGHAVVAKLLKHSDPVHKVTIIPRGRALGVTMQLPEEDRFSHKAEYLKDKITILMGGRAAEEIFCKTRTNGASNDISVATSIAKSMVTEWGMSSLGPIAFASRDGGGFLSNGQLSTAGLSESTLRKVEETIHNMLNDEYEHAKKILEDNRDIVEEMTKALMKVETIDDWQIENLMKRRSFDDPKGLIEMNEKNAIHKKEINEPTPIVIQIETKEPFVPDTIIQK